MAAALSSDTQAEVANLALRLGAVDAISFTAGWEEELPVLAPVLSSLEVIRKTMATAKNNREELTALAQKCAYIVAVVIVKHRHNPSSMMDVTPLEDCVDTARKFFERCGQRSKVSRLLKASRTKDEITELNARIDRVVHNLGLQAIGIPKRQVTDVETLSVR